MLGLGAKMFSCCGARHLPASAGLLGICRPLPLARLLPPATGGSRLAPHRGSRHRLRHGCECGVWGCVLGNHATLTVGAVCDRPQQKSLTVSVKLFYHTPPVITTNNPPPNTQNAVVITGQTNIQIHVFPIVCFDSSFLRSVKYNFKHRIHKISGMGLTIHPYTNKVPIRDNKFVW